MIEVTQRNLLQVRIVPIASARRTTLQLNVRSCGGRYEETHFRDLGCFADDDGTYPNSIVRACAGTSHSRHNWG
jgi:hypothetical protein